MKNTKTNRLVAFAVAVAVIGGCIPLVARYNAPKSLSAAALYPYPLETYRHGG